MFMTFFLSSHLLLRVGEWAGWYCVTWFKSLSLNPEGT
jgi:hypothetical protein